MGENEVDVERVKAAIAEKMAPAIDARAPYAKVMFDMAARAALTAMQGWRPIESAPKDGTDVILCGPSPDGPRRTVGRWAQSEECRTQIGDCGGECRCPEYEYCDPWWMSWDGGFSKEWPCTHWRPLPEPPQEGE